MSDSPNRIDNDITFTVGKGNQSAICGAVVPMDVVNPKSEADARQSEGVSPTDAATRDR